LIEFPNSETFAAALAEPRIFAAVAVAALAGLTRGFSGFGGAMIYMPLIATIYDPRIAAVTILLVDLVSATPFAIPEVRRCTWREVTPLSLAMAVGLPIGLWLIAHMEGGIGITVPILAASLVYLDVFDFGEHPGQWIYLGAYVAFLLVAIPTVLHYRRSVRPAGSQTQAPVDARSG